MTTTLVLPESIAAELAEMARDPAERAAVLIVGRARPDGTTTRLLARRLWQPPAHTYTERVHDSLVLGSDGWVPALSDRKSVV